MSNDHLGCLAKTEYCQWRFLVSSDCSPATLDLALSASEELGHHVTAPAYCRESWTIWGLDWAFGPFSLNQGACYEVGQASCLKNVVHIEVRFGQNCSWTKGSPSQNNDAIRDGLRQAQEEFALLRAFSLWHAPVDWKEVTFSYFCRSQIAKPTCEISRSIPDPEQASARTFRCRWVSLPTLVAANRLHWYQTQWSHVIHEPAYLTLLK